MRVSTSASVLDSKSVSLLDSPELVLIFIKVSIFVFVVVAVESELLDLSEAPVRSVL